MKKEILTSTLIKSSLGLQILLDVHKSYLLIYFLVTISLMIYKGIQLKILTLGMVFPYSNGVYGLELFGLLPFVVLELSRLFIGNRGNLIPHSQSVVLFMGLTVISIFVYLFYLLWQSYVVVVDLVVGGLGLGFMVGQLVFGLSLLRRI